MTPNEQKNCLVFNFLSAPHQAQNHKKEEKVKKSSLEIGKIRKIPAFADNEVLFLSVAERKF